MPFSQSIKNHGPGIDHPAHGNDCYVRNVDQVLIFNTLNFVLPADYCQFLFEEWAGTLCQLYNY